MYEYRQRYTSWMGLEYEELQGCMVVIGAFNIHEVQSTILLLLLAVCHVKRLQHHFID